MDCWSKIIFDGAADPIGSLRCLALMRFESKRMKRHQIRGPNAVDVSLRADRDDAGQILDAAKAIATRANPTTRWRNTHVNFRSVFGSHNGQHRNHPIYLFRSDIIDRNPK